MAVTLITLGEGLVVGSTTVVEGGSDVVIVVGVAEVVVISGVDVEVSVMVTVVVGDVVKLVEVVVTTVVTTESVADVVSIQFSARTYTTIKQLETRTRHR